MSGRPDRKSRGERSSSAARTVLSRSFWGSGGGLTLITLGGAGLLVAALVAVPLKNSKTSGRSPAADAEAIRRTLTMQFETSLDSEETPEGAADSTAGPDEMEPGIRDLFNPARPAGRAAPRAVQAAPRLPRLSGLFLDGGVRLAVINGQTAGEGDEVSGYRVAAIRAGRVVLERGGEAYTLDWKGVEP